METIQKVVELLETRLQEIDEERVQVSEALERLVGKPKKAEKPVSEKKPKKEEPKKKSSFKGDIDEAILEVMKKEPDRAFSVQQLSELSGVSTSSVHRRMKSKAFVCVAEPTYGAEKAPAYYALTEVVEEKKSGEGPIKLHTVGMGARESEKTKLASGEEEIVFQTAGGEQLGTIPAE